MFRLQPIYDPTKRGGLVTNGIGHTRFSLVGSKHVEVGVGIIPKGLGYDMETLVLGG